MVGGESALVVHPVVPRGGDHILVDHLPLVVRPVLLLHLVAYVLVPLGGGNHCDWFGVTRYTAL